MTITKDLIILNEPIYITYSPNFNTRMPNRRDSYQAQQLLVIIMVGNDIDWRCTGSRLVKW
jgi:hypothetical protein